MKCIHPLSAWPAFPITLCSGRSAWGHYSWWLSFAAAPCTTCASSCCGWRQTSLLTAWAAPVFLLLGHQWSQQVSLLVGSVCWLVFALVYQLVWHMNTYASRFYCSLAFVLSSLGYDVWLGNFRGNAFGRKHETLDPDTDGQFWRLGSCSRW